MEFNDWVIAIVVVVGIAVGTAASSTLSESEVFKPKSEFHADVVYSINNSTHGEGIKFFNRGNAQAKNAVLFIGSKEPVLISNYHCLEGREILPKLDIIHKIEFEKVSTNVDCIIEFYNSPNKNINTIIATADDTNGYQHEFGAKKDQYPFLGINLDSTYVLIVFSYTFAAIAFLYWINRRIRSRRLSENIRKEEKDSKTDLERYQHEVNLIENKIKEVGASKIPEELMARRAHLIEESKQLRNIVDELQVVKKKPLMIEEIGNFFNNWINVERQLRIKGGLDTRRGEYQSITNLIDELKNKSLLSQQESSKLKSVFHFRNELIHGKIEPSRSELKKNIQELIKILPKLEQIIPIAVGEIIRIPAGSSVPGCEKTNECYIPSKATIKEDQIVTWMNNDTAAHTVTSGTPNEGPDGMFDSSLFMSQNTFSYKFKKKGTYHYYCMVHPWQKGVVEVT